MYKLLILSLVIGLSSCRNQNGGTSEILASTINNTTPKMEIEKLSPHIIVSEGTRNEGHANECNIELAVGNSIVKVDSFIPSYIERKQLIYIDLAKNPNVVEENSMIEIADLQKVIYPKKYGQLLNMTFATQYEEKLDIPINRYCIFLNDSKLTITKDAVNVWDEPEKDIERDFEVIYSKSLSELINEVKNPSSSNIRNAPQKEFVSNKKQFQDILVTLTDATYKKGKVYLGEPDTYQFAFGHNTKGFAVYYNAVANGNGEPKHLVLFLRMQGYQWGDNCMIEKIVAVSDNEQVSFGIHHLKISNGKIITNAANLDY